MTPGQRGETRRRSRLLTASDCILIGQLLVLSPIAWVAPRAMWRPAARLLAAAHRAARGSRAGELEGTEAIAHLGLTPSRLERDFLAGAYLDLLYLLGEYAFWRRGPEVELDGEEHVRAALTEGRGAVLWIWPCTFAELITKKAFSDAGLPYTNLRSSIHPFSGSEFGRRVLNPIATRIEDPLLAATVTLGDAGGSVALQALREAVTNGSLVSITAIGSGTNSVDVPFLGGTLSLAPGAPALAITNRAPLLPVATYAVGDHGFRVHVGAPLEVPEGVNRREAARHLARAYADRMLEHVTSSPTTWRGWFNRNQWRPTPAAPANLGRQ